MSDPSTRLLELLIDEAGARAEEALERGVLSIRPERVMAYVSVADCTSRLLPTLRSRLYDKVRRVASAVHRTADATASRRGHAAPAVELRLRHSALLLSGHPAGSWSVLVHTLNDAAHDAGIERITAPLVTWNLLDISGRLEQVLPNADRVVFRADLGNVPDPTDIRGLAFTLPLSGPCRAVLSAGASACPVVHPDVVELRASGRIPAWASHDPLLFKAAAALLAEQGIRFTRDMSVNEPGWHAGTPAVDIDEHQLHMAAVSRNFAWTSAGWPISRGGSNRMLPSSMTDPETLARGLADRLMPISGSDAPATALPRYVAIDVPS
ncbi:MAG: hypothetical protein RIE53_06000 [Rhodothermales bacterium]